MALLIEKNVSVLGDITLSQLYVRLTVSYGPEGNVVLNNNYVYSSKNAYELSSSNYFNVNGISNIEQFNYDREVDGLDILMLAHNNLKTLLSTDIMKNVPVLDPSTGDPTYDSSTGDLITEEVIDVPKFAMDSSISVIDMPVA